jgi:hypothetical protein
MMPGDKAGLTPVLGQAIKVSNVSRIDATCQALNAAVVRQVDDLRDFIRLRCISEHRDTPCGQELAGSPLNQLADRLALWQTKFPGTEDAKGWQPA